MDGSALKGVTHALGDRLQLQALPAHSAACLRADNELHERYVRLLHGVASDQKRAGATLQ